jgi:putative copper resistance protein D
VQLAGAAEALGHWSFAADWVWVIGVTGLLYGLGLHRARLSGARHDRDRILAFYAGLATMAVAFLTPIDSFDNLGFVDHVAQHLLFAFVAAPLLAMGGPIGLAREALPRVAREKVLDPLLESPVAEVLSHPVAATALFLFIFVGVQAGPLFNDALNSGWPHFLQHQLLLVGAFVFWRALTGIDQPSRDVDPATRLALSTMLVVVVAVLGSAFVMARSPLYSHYAKLPAPWGGGEALKSQRQAGWLLLVGGTVLTIAMARVSERARSRARWK